MTRENLQVEIAVLVSLLLHALLFGAYQQRATLLRLPLFRPLARLSTPASSARRRPATPVVLPTISFVQTKEAAAPKMFMETDARQATGQEPKNARYYSDRATVAANPDNPTGKTGDTPYLAGTETRVMSTENVPRPTAGGGRPAVAAPAPPAAPARPAAPPAAATTPAAPAVPRAPAALTPPPAPAKAAPKEVAPQGLAVIKEEPQVAQVRPAESYRASPAPAGSPAPVVVPSAGGGAPSSARELVAAKSRLTASGIDRRGVAAFNVAASPFGDYDRRLIRAVQSRWLLLIDQHELYERAGSVTIHFELRDDGVVQGLQVAENSAGEILALYCEKAILDSAPFPPLPEPLRVLVGREPREVNFTFYY